MAIDLRRDMILAAGVVIVQTTGFAGVSCRSVAARCILPTSPQIVKYHYANRDGLCRAIATYAACQGYKGVADEAKRLGFAE